MRTEHLQPDQALILVVDDDMSLRFLVRQALEPAGFRVEEAENGLEALQRLEQLNPDIVLLDVRMPRLDGFETCRRLRALPGGEEIPVIMVTGLEDVESIQSAYDVGATDFITKPINWLILSHRVRYILRSSRAFRDLHRSETRLARAQQIAKLGNWEWDIVNDRLHWSDEIYRIFGLAPQSFGATYQAFLQAVHPDDRVAVEAAVQEALEQRVKYDIDHRIVLPDGTERVVQEQAEVTCDAEGKAVLMAGTVQDITRRKEAEERIRFLAYYDTLTGLPNRVLFREHARKALMLARRTGTLVGILQLDLDRFKEINDSLGHGAGDELLRLVTEVMESCVRCSDQMGRCSEETTEQARVARMGGDEFTFLLTHFTDAECCGEVAARVLQKLKGNYSVRRQEVFVTASIGIAVYPADGESVEDLLKNSETAMFHAKKAGADCARFYTPSMNERALQRLNLEAKLRQALEREELCLHYQPQMELGSGRITGVEALIRWNRPGHGMVPPGEFIEIAERSGLIVPIGEWVLVRACRQFTEWAGSGIDLAHMSVNLSNRQFRERGLVRMLEAVLGETRLQPGMLELEITESLVMHDVETSTRTLHGLKEMGVRVSVDDFGTGYSSLGYLKTLPLDELKIDRSFVTDLVEDRNDAAIVNAVIALAHSLGLGVVAEGVETEAQLGYLRQQGCDMVQGYLLSRPLPHEGAAALIREVNAGAWSPGKG